MRIDEGPTNWRDEYKAMEQAWMVLKDQYAELARALGSPADGWFGDPLESHDDVMARASALVEKLRVALTAGKCE